LGVARVYFPPWEYGRNFKEPIGETEGFIPIRIVGEEGNMSILKSGLQILI
jgi:hypothetical protein